MSFLNNCVDNYVDKCVENVVGNPQKHPSQVSGRDIHRLILRKKRRFPRFFAEKRYKLIKFAPKKGIVDKLIYHLIIREIELTIIVESQE